MQIKSNEDIAYSAIMELIVQHSYQPGSPVVESQLAKKLKMSRTPVHSALKMLVSDGLLDNTVNKGCFVPNLSKEDLEELFNFRFAVEPPCVIDAAFNYSPIYRGRMDALIEEEAASIKDNPGKLHVIDSKIHDLISEIAGNSYYMRSIKQAHWRTQLYLFFYDDHYANRVEKLKLREKGGYKSPMQHIMLFDAIADRDPEKAAVIVREHINSTHIFLSNKKW